MSGSWHCVAMACATPAWNGAAAELYAAAEMPPNAQVPVTTASAVAVACPDHGAVASPDSGAVGGPDSFSHSGPHCALQRARDLARQRQVPMRSWVECGRRLWSLR